MSGIDNKRVVVADVMLLKPAIDTALQIARESADSGPTGFGQVVVTGDGKVVVLRAPSQADELQAPLDVIQSFGDAERAERIWLGYHAQQELQKARGNS